MVVRPVLQQHRASNVVVVLVAFMIMSPSIGLAGIRRLEIGQSGEQSELTSSLASAEPSGHAQVTVRPDSMVEAIDQPAELDNRIANSDRAVAEAMNEIEASALAAEKRKLRPAPTIDGEATLTRVFEVNNDSLVEQVVKIYNDSKGDLVSICARLGCNVSLVQKNQPSDASQFAQQMINGFYTRADVVLNSGPADLSEEHMGTSKVSIAMSKIDFRVNDKASEGSEAGNATFENTSQADFQKFLQSLPAHEPHHICLTGNNAMNILQKELLPPGAQLEEFTLPSKLHQDNICQGWQQAIGHTLITASPMIEDRCAARWKVQLLSCDILLHAHHGHDCQELLKLRLIANENVPTVLLHSDKALMQCFYRRLSESQAHAAYLQDLEPIQFISQQDGITAGCGLLRISLMSALKKAVSTAHPRSPNSADINFGRASSYSSLRLWLLSSLPHQSDFHVELLRHSQGYSTNASTMLRMWDKAAVVIDSVSGNTFAGFAGEDAPQYIFPTVVGRCKLPFFCPLGVGGSYVGEQALSKRGILRLYFPIQSGIVINWDDMETIWGHIFYNKLRIPPENVAVLLTEAPLNPKSSREHATRIMFENFKVPDFFLVNSAVAALYAMGRTTGVVVDIGETVTHIVPIYAGHALAHAVERVYIGASDLSLHLAWLVQRQRFGDCYNALSPEIWRDMREKLCFVVRDYEYTRSLDDQGVFARTYETADGTIIKVDFERYECTEVFFKPYNLHRFPLLKFGLQYQAHSAILKCDPDIRRDLYSNIVLSGIAASLDGFGDRFQQELIALAPSNMKVRVTGFGEVDGSEASPWLGGSILSSLATFQNMWISMQAYDESGPSIANRKPWGM